MIKKSTNPDGEINEFFCNSCHVKIGWCWEFKFEEGQELLYAPLLCEKCGKKVNEQLGDIAAFRGMLKKLLSGAEKDKDEK